MHKLEKVDFATNGPQVTLSPTEYKFHVNPTKSNDPFAWLYYVNFFTSNDYEFSSLITIESMTKDMVVMVERVEWHMGRNRCCREKLVDFMLRPFRTINRNDRRKAECRGKEDH
ncbi:hypothetical protein PV325_003497 [Microctonus aethiopoides]|nr:hypothetical protein PV326_006139 [Microctonus aethiopoides]KAK0086246.1 hypothetical protein PV325_003497 [Microctonus aethiopoides]